MHSKHSTQLTETSGVFVPPPGSPTPYAFEQVMRASGGTEPARLEAQNRLFEKQGPLDQLPPLPADGRILDAGSGTGYWSVRLAGLVPRGRVVCLDRSPDLLERARARLEQAGFPRSEYLQQDLRDLHLPADTFDLVFTSMTLVHVAELDEALSPTRPEPCRLPGGRGVGCG
jgi:SAM-dependent methyltransferase